MWDIPRDFFLSFTELLGGAGKGGPKVLKTRTIGAMNMSQVVLDGVCNVESENTTDFDAGIHA